MPVWPIFKGKVVEIGNGMRMSLNLHVIGDHSSIYSCSAGTNSSSKLVSKGVQSEEDEIKSNFKLSNSSFNAGATHTVPKLSPLFIPLPPLTTTEAAPRSGRSDLLSSCRKKNVQSKRQFDQLSTYCGYTSGWQELLHWKKDASLSFLPAQQIPMCLQWMLLQQVLPPPRPNLQSSLPPQMPLSAQLQSDQFMQIKKIDY